MERMPAGRRAQWNGVCDDEEEAVRTRNVLQALVEIGAELTLAAGGVAVAVGAGLIYPPAGLIVGGALAMGLGLLALLGGEDP